MKGEANKRVIGGRLIFVFIICVTMIIDSTITAVTISDALGNQRVSVPYVLSYTIHLKEPTFGSTQLASSEYTTVYMEGCLNIGEQAGDPLVPVKTVTLLLPPKKAMTSINVVGTPVSINPCDIDLKEKPILPYQKSIPIGSYEPKEFIKNVDTYSSSGPYPSAIYNDYQIGCSHGYTILDLSLNPIQYNPKDGTLVYYSQMTVNIHLRNTNYVNRFFSNNPIDKAYIKNLVLNPDIADLYQEADLPTFEYPGGLCDSNEHYDYVIITTTQNGLDYWDTSSSTPFNWQSLMDWHYNKDGLLCTEVTVQEINACPDYWNSTYYPLFNDTQAHIREFCRDAYKDWGTIYVLIAGDADTIPARQLYYPYEGNVDSDLYWSNLDNDFNNDHDSLWGEPEDTGFDLYSDIYVGRVTCDIPQDVSNWLTKNFFYSDSFDTDYLENTGFFGNHSILEYSAISEFEKWNSNNPEIPYNLSVQTTDVNEFKDAINNDQVTLISGVDHADNQMSLNVYSESWEADYHNTKPFFIFDLGCHCGDFDASDDGVLDTMLFFSNTTLAFGCVYNTGYGWANIYDTNTSSSYQQKMFWDYFFDLENNSHSPSNWQLGKAMTYSKDKMAPYINEYTGTWRGVIEGCLLFADPALTIKTPNPNNPPVKPSTPVGPTSGAWYVQYSYTSVTTDPDGDQIYYMFDWGDDSNSGWIGLYNPGITANASHSWSAAGDYEIKVKAKDTNGAESDWSDPLTITIVENEWPTKPIISGSTNGKVGVTYKYGFNSTDLDNDMLVYWIDWGDGAHDEIIGPSGYKTIATHTWPKKGNYLIKAQAKDIWGAKSDWGQLEVSMPKIISLNLSLMKLLKRFPHAFSLLRYILGFNEFYQ